jgi:hypothetical protein
VVALALALAVAAPAWGQEAGTPAEGATPPAAATTADTTATVATATGAKAPWRGSLLALRTETTLLTLDRGAELTYNPYVAMSFEARPRWWFGDVFYLALDFSLVRELTDSDDTTMAGETWLGDVNVGGGAAKFWTLPWVGIDLSADLRVITPTSKLSRARTMQAALRGGLTLSRTFPVLSGLTVSYLCQGTGYFHRHTTSELSSPLISGCGSEDGSCDRFANSGVRNSKFRLGNAATVSMDFLPWLGLDATAMHRLDFLYPAADDDPRISFVPQEPTDRRHSLVYEIELRFQPMKSLGIGVGVSSLNPLQAPDSSHYKPFVNRYTMAYLELRLPVDGLVSQIRGED